MIRAMTGTGPRPPAILWAVLLLIGIAWGATQPLSKFGMQAAYHPVAVALWQAAIGVAITGTLLILRGERLPLSRIHLAFYAVCGLLGTALPSSLSYTAIQHLPVGVHSIVLATVPMMTLLVALPLGLDRAEPRRLLGLGLGLLGVVLLVAPDTSLPEPGQAAWALVTAAVALSYALENVVIARYCPPGTSALQIMCGLVIAALAMLVPAVLIAGIDPMPHRAGAEEAALALLGTLNVCAYLGLVWLIGRAGPVFAAQVAYVVTATGVLAGMAAFGERHSPWVWAALAATFAGLALVRPREPKPQAARTEAVT